MSSSVSHDVSPSDTHLAAAQTAADAGSDPRAAAAAGPEPLGMRPRRLWRHGAGACVFSTVFHVAILMALSLWLMPAVVTRTVQTILAEVIDEERRDDLLKIELEDQLQPATVITQATVTSIPKVGASGAAAGGVEQPALDRKVVERLDAPPIRVGSPTLSIPSPTQLIESVPDGALGDSRAIVDDYQQALDRITQEIMWMLDRGDVLVVWCFDQSESMKDDQREIRDRVQRVYAELGLTSKASGDHLLTSVVSFGSDYASHTKKPTSDPAEIRKAINDVPIDPSGEEMMCQAVGRAIAAHREFVRRGRRQMALILVTDESGNANNNNEFLELAIAEAKASQCTVYTLGREAVFGYPHAFIRWEHPDTNRIHWLPVDRGPETAFVEQLQTNGFRRRHDAFSSGFGPYEQTRISRETGGIFFMLPTVEKDLVQSEKRRYTLDAMQSYRPDLRARIEVLKDRDDYPLRTLVWKVIYDLNPYNDKAARSIEMRMQFSLQPEEFVRQARAEQLRARQFIEYLAWAEKTLEEGRALRDQEISPRWRANYDLILAQVVAYQARLYEYGVALEDFLKDPKTAPSTRSPNRILVHWDIQTATKTRTEESKPYIDKSTALFKEVMRTHPGTPWAARAQSELGRGFGIDLVPDYQRPYKTVANPSPPPKL